MQLSINKLLKTGWKPKYTSRQAVRLATKGIIKELNCKKTDSQYTRDMKMQKA